MGCELNPSIPYTEFSVIIKKQKEVPECLFDKVLHLSLSLLSNSASPVSPSDHQEADRKEAGPDPKGLPGAVLF